ncbi:hypothetical protein MA03_04355 [Infirmifilum uzonense]|uniref:NADH:quinone oxidoreductase/Mrp antiporter transmembrane domain-containing protein n=1 Tax=Infirmifilum uzonense TaxID=1550241 RepID=A0A0F7CL24_9CREN|nr:proton-conducting transporter membrane subunit [Infirmifilum uzonense]AKG38666.1 hypothetical protein MA03_04355 [Infirmifilum uzonense]
MLEEALINIGLCGVLLYLVVRLLPQRFRKPVSTTMAAILLLIVLYLSLSERSPVGLIGLTSSLIGIAAVVTGYSLIEEDVSTHNLLILVLCVSSILITHTKDLVKVFLEWEILSTAVVSLTAYHRNKEGAEAAFKYLMLCGAGTALALIGIILVFIETGSTSIHSVPSSSILAKIFLLLGFGTEAALFPLHFWLPDAHMAAPSTASAVLSGVVIESAAILVYRLVFGEELIRYIVLPLALIGAFIGNLSAYKQDDLKRLLAFSSFANVNYILLAWATGNNLATVYAFLHVFAHGLLKSALFIVSGVLLAEYGTRHLSKLYGVASKNNVLKFTVILASLGLTGAPPLLTFWSELYMGVGLFQFNVLVGLGFMFSIIISFAYYFRIFYTLASGSNDAVHLRHRVALLTSFLLVLFSLVAFIFCPTIVSYFGL